MLGPECGRDVRFTLRSCSQLHNCKCTDSKLKPATLVIVARWDGPDANFSSRALVTAAGASHPTLVYAFPVSSHSSGAVACFFFSIILLAFPLFYFLFPPPLLSLPLHDPYFTHSSIKGWGGCFVCMCVSSGSLKREDFDPFSLVCPSTNMFLFRLYSSTLSPRIQI